MTDKDELARQIPGPYIDYTVYDPECTCTEFRGEPLCPLHGDPSYPLITSKTRAFLLWLIEYKRQETGNPWWPWEPPMKVAISMKAQIDQKIRINETVARRHNVSALEAQARLQQNERLRRKLEDA